MIEVTDEMKNEVMAFVINEFGEAYISSDFDGGAILKRVIELHEASKPKTKPEQPVAYYLPDQGGLHGADFRLISGISESEKKYFHNWLLLYTAPQTREPLTEEKCNELFQWYAMQANLLPNSITPLDMIRAVEKAHKIGV